MSIDDDKIKMKWIVSVPEGERCVGITQWRDMVLIATDAGKIYQLMHDESRDDYRLQKVAQ